MTSTKVEYIYRLMRLSMNVNSVCDRTHTHTDVLLFMVTIDFNFFEKYGFFNI